MRNLSRSTVIALGLVGTAVVLFLAFGVFGVQTLFIDKTVDEANPFADAAQVVDQPLSNTAVVDDVAMDDDTAIVEEAEAVEAESEEAETEELPAVATLLAGSFTDGAHPTAGEGVVLSDGAESFLRFENFETDNGPDLNVYLRSSANPDDYIDLGDLKGNIGDQNYELPANFDAETYDVVDIWCVRFGVSFGSAQLTAV